MLSFLQEREGHVYLFVRPIDAATAAWVAEIEKPIKVVPGSAPFQDIERIDDELVADKSTEYFWKTDQYIVFSKGGHLYRADASKAGANSTPEDLTPFGNADADFVDDLEGISDTAILISLNKRDASNPDVYLLNVVDPNPSTVQMVAKNDFGAQSWLVDHAGIVRAAVAFAGRGVVLRTRPDGKSAFTVLPPIDFTEPIDLQGYTQDNKLIYAISSIGRDKAALVQIDPESGKEVGAPIFKRRDVDLDYLEFSKTRKIPVAVRYHTSKLQRHFLDQQTEKLFKALDLKFPKLVILLTAHDRREEKFIVRVLGDRYPDTYYYFDSRTNGFQELVNVAPEINSADLAETKSIQYGSSGETIHGYLTLPRGGQKKNLPTVVMPHGGPWIRDKWMYNPDVQLLANRGYAVLQMNFRGSTGYGKRFWRCGFQEWGRKMQDDITAGVKWLIRRGIADPKHVAIYGESYGGYAALAGIAFTPNLYCAAADRAGVANLTDFLIPQSTLPPPEWIPFLPQFKVEVGDAANSEDLKMLRRYSPMLAANKIKKPILISHGRNDNVVYCDQSTRMIEQLKQNGLDPEPLLLTGEEHIYGRDSDVRFHEMLDHFLQVNMGK